MISWHTKYECPFENLTGLYLWKSGLLMWTFDFAIDYTMMDKRVITHEHQVKIDEPGLKNERMALDWVKDTFPYEEFDELIHLSVRHLSTNKPSEGTGQL